ncbi:MAG: M48 family metallopeptidase [Paracoccaceae bacterium]
MTKLLPFLLAIGAGLVMWHVSVWRTRQELARTSAPLRDRDLMIEIDKLAIALDPPGIEVHVIDIEPVNGLATPDGKVYITRGFLDRVRAGQVTAPEIAGVVAHELGHVALGHARRRMIEFSGQNALRIALAAVLGRFLPGLGVWVANLLVTMLSAHLSRSDEFEADEFAAALMVRAGLGVGPLVSLFHKLDHLSGMRGAPPVWLASHPPTTDRIAAIETLNRRWDSEQA